MSCNKHHKVCVYIFTLCAQKLYAYYKTGTNFVLITRYVHKHYDAYCTMYIENL